MIDIEIVEASQFHKILTSGRTSPLLITCERASGEVLDVVAKFAGGRHCTKNSLCAEMIAAQLAADLGLPIPKPVSVGWDAVFANSVMDPSARQVIAASTPPAFGSTFFSGGFVSWNGPRKFVSDAQRQMALAIFVFDTLIGNPDRSTEKPNLVVQGEQFRVFDHELGFHDFELLIRPAMPWMIGGFNPSLTPRKHIFATQLCKDCGKLEFAAIHAAWSGLSDARIEAYVTALPAIWKAGAKLPDFAVQRIKQCRDRIDECVLECRRALNAKA